MMFLLLKSKNQIRWLGSLMILSFVMSMTLSGCQKTNDTVQAVRHFAGDLIAAPAPKASEIKLALPNVSPEELNFTAQNYVSPVQAASNKKNPPKNKIVYFDDTGKISPNPIPDGFYRVILPNGTDGRAQVQDFYQKTQLPQTTVLTLKNGANPEDFTTAALDGRNIWFAENGELRSVADYADGKQLGARVFYQNKQMVAAITDTKAVVFHENGRILSVLEPDESDSSVLKTTLFREDGSAVVQSRMRGEKVLSATVWQPDGSHVRKQADLNKIQQETTPISKRADGILRLIHE